MSELPSGTEIDTTVEAAAGRIADLLSPREEPQPDEPEAPAPEAAQEPEAPAASAEEAEEPTEPDSPEAPSASPAATLRMDDGTEWTADDVKKGALRQADYTRKTQALAEQRKAFEAEAEAVRAERATYAERLTQLEAVLTEQAPSTEGLDALRQSDPAEWAARMTEITAHQQRLATVQSERQRAEAKVAEDRAKAHAALVEAEREKLLDAFPVWRTDTAQAQADLAAIRAAGADYGFSDQELDSVVDHRAIKLLHDASEYRKMLAAQAKAQPKIAQAPVLKPGSTGKVVPKPTSDLRRAVQQATKSGKVDDAAKAIAALLDAGG